MSEQNNIDRKSISRIREERKSEPTVAELVKGIVNGDKSSLGRAITLIESTQKTHLQKANEIIEKCLTQNVDSIRIGITGVPGVGKSTFIETLGKTLAQEGNKVAVLAIDPTSTQNKGSILGDKTRMAGLAKAPNAYIRPSPTSESLGGVARKTRETIILCEAAGHNVILIETVGVGQSETAVHSMVDFFLLLKLAGAGDDLQGIKRGIIEMADAIVINKADGQNLQAAKLAEIEFRRALELYPPKENGWKPKVSSCSSLENKGLEEIWNMICSYIASTKKSKYFSTKRKLQNKNWLLETIEERLKSDFFQNNSVASEMETYIQKVISDEISPFQAAEELITISKKKINR
mgnify:CR=1 FL=1